jgi:hypothetical protein
MSEIKFVFETMAPGYRASVESLASGAPVVVTATGSAVYVGKPGTVDVPGGKEYFAILKPLGSEPDPADAISAEGTFEGDVTVTFGTLVERG